MDAATYKELKVGTPHHEKTEAFGGPGGGTNINNPAYEQSKHNPYELGPESTQPTSGAPSGTITHATMEGSEAFPGTTRDTWLYVPAQYDKVAPANLLVCFDGGGYVDRMGVPVVLDNLIHRQDLPPTIAVFLSPGKNPDYAQQRSHEYDTVDDVNATFLIEEVLPPIAAKYNISDDPKRRCVAGLSSGGIAAFSVAWFRPDSFGCVISWIGSFTNIRGGHNYPWLVRNNPRKPIKVFMQDGKNDLNNQHVRSVPPLACQCQCTCSCDPLRPANRGVHRGRGGWQTWRWRRHSGTQTMNCASSGERATIAARTAHLCSRIHCAGCGLAPNVRPSFDHYNTFCNPRTYPRLFGLLEKG
jgi:poly(3-hydroxybutyrate) depolymerase